MPNSDTTVLLLPGMTLNSSIFPDLEPPTIAGEFSELVLSPDGGLAPGVGNGLSVYADQLDELLTGTPRWQVEKRIVVAHSFGGMLALWWWLNRHGAGLARIDGMVLVSTTGGPMFDDVKLRLAKLGSMDIRFGVRRTIRLWNTPLVTRLMKRIHTKGRLDARRVDFRTLRWRSDLALDFAGWRNTDWRSMRTFRQAVMGFDVRDKLGEVNVPTIVLHGSEDVIFPVEVGRRLANALPNAEFRLVEGAAHGLPLTHGEGVVRAVRELAVGR